MSSAGPSQRRTASHPSRPIQAGDFENEMIMRNALAHVDFAAHASAASEHKIGLVGRIARALIIRRERRALLALDDRMLADVGLSRADAYREAHRPFLDMPSSVNHSLLR